MPSLLALSSLLGNCCRNLWIFGESIALTVAVGSVSFYIASFVAHLLTSDTDIQTFSTHSDGFVYRLVYLRQNPR